TARAATVFNNWGVSLTLLGRPVDAERALGRAIAISRDAEGDGAVSPMLLVNYARTLQDVGRLNDAAAFGERGLDKARKAGAGVVVSQALLLLGSIDRNLGDLDGAERRLSEVGAWLRRNLPPGPIASASLAPQQSRLADAGGDLATARTLADQAVAMADAAAAKGRIGDYLAAFLTRRSDILRRVGRLEDAAADADRALGLVRGAVPSGA